MNQHLTVRQNNIYVTLAASRVASNLLFLSLFHIPATKAEFDAVRLKLNSITLGKKTLKAETVPVSSVEDKVSRRKTGLVNITLRAILISFHDFPRLALSAPASTLPL